MSWIAKELRKRTAEPVTTAPDSASPAGEALPGSARMTQLWSRFMDFNRSLPKELQLQRDTSRTVLTSPEEANMREWLVAPNGAALGFDGRGVRYVWPHRTTRRSKNFWLRWSAQKQGYVLNQRIDATVPPTIGEYGFDERKVEYIIKCLVLTRCVKVRAVRPRRFWIF